MRKILFFVFIFLFLFILILLPLPVVLFFFKIFWNKFVFLLKQETYA
jgi:hypothetical protein